MANLSKRYRLAHAQLRTQREALAKLDHDAQESRRACERVVNSSREEKARHEQILKEKEAYIARLTSDKAGLAKEMEKLAAEREGLSVEALKAKELAALVRQQLDASQKEGAELQQQNRQAVERMKVAEERAGEATLGKEAALKALSEEKAKAAQVGESILKDFKQSQEYMDALVAFAQDAFYEGIDLAREELDKLFPDLGIAAVRFPFDRDLPVSEEPSTPFEPPTPADVVMAEGNAEEMPAPEPILAPTPEPSSSVADPTADAQDPGQQ